MNISIIGAGSIDKRRLENILSLRYKNIAAFSFKNDSSAIFPAGKNL
ncbi:MAG: hypothetical protein ABJA79_05800 [Parafilimonas sp.]